ncbi:carbohydrate-binding module family 13 protein [Serpula lacrymans var. lacrymans S7.3]|uniref:Carbohydrate-binding module family 13 protein n=2 Tax=Serpula lacrymans var. lacrymans TaxID=341189 RepID=F8Q9B4_SERL3|nr:uncharacterized protein SERLADRAFT_477093 [Serpula lacrymans var. lacrymans S7.9]EGN95169.1 carbohydrate-binding module family 13 protein [Serpula lacrymans var. lacrymans S7.3]EGO20680.1 hypothetical protein SERLADRAFT_477093 [Serpula lacrymans var. lacrymans S7.9]
MLIIQGGTTDGTKVQGWGKWSFSSAYCLPQLRLVTPTGATDAFTLQNLRGGLYLDLPNGSSANGNPLQGWQRVGNDRVWIIRQTGTFYKMQNLQGGSTCSLHSVLIALRARETTRDRSASVCQSSRWVCHLSLTCLYHAWIH